MCQELGWETGPGKHVRGPDQKWMLSKATPWPLKHATESITLSKNFDTVKSSYIFCTDGGDPIDEILAGKRGKLDGPHKVIESGHWPMITKPDELVKGILKLSGQISRPSYASGPEPAKS